MMVATTAIVVAAKGNGQEQGCRPAGAGRAREEERPMKVESILKSKGTKVVTTGPDAKIATVIQKLRLERVGALVIRDDGKQVLGLVSERDIVHGLAERGPELLSLRVADLMTRGGPTCVPDDSIRKVMVVMTQRRVRHLPVLADRKLVGIISIGDVVKNRLEEVELEANVLRDAYIAAR
jgi:CBS domain-containing protein